MGNNWQLHHVALAVRDLDKAIEYYQSLGIATMEPEFTFDSSEFKDFEVYGKPGHIKGKARMVHIGSLPLEFIQPLEGRDPNGDFLDRCGEGVAHICFMVDDLEKEATELVEKGAKIILSGKDSDGGLVFAYFDTVKVGNIIIELMQRT